MAPARCADCLEELDEHLSWCGLRDLRLQKQPNEWTCLPTAFAMVEKVPVQAILDFLGRPGGPEGFHPQELIEWALIRRGRRYVLFEAKPEWEGPLKLSPVDRWLSNYDGVLMNEKHAAAWIQDRVHDPNYTTYDLSKFGELQVFIARVG